jgi:hypothetical protein
MAHLNGLAPLLSSQWNVVRPQHTCNSCRHWFSRWRYIVCVAFDLFLPNLKRKRFKIKQIGLFKGFIWSNLCTRDIPKKLTPRGHEDWPDKRPSR